jgi:hypothetical protein
MLFAVAILTQRQSKFSKKAILNRTNAAKAVRNYDKNKIKFYTSSRTFFSGHIVSIGCVLHHKHVLDWFFFMLIRDLYRVSCI